jgi:hypothetical protein
MASALSRRSRYFGLMPDFLSPIARTQLRLWSGFFAARRMTTEGRLHNTASEEGFLDYAA